MKKKNLLRMLALLLAISLVAIGCPAPTPAPTPTPTPTSAPAPGVEPIVLDAIGWSTPIRVKAHSGDWIRARLYERSEGRLIVNYKGGTEVIAKEEQFAALQSGIVDLLYAPGAFHEPLLYEMNLIHLAELSIDGLPRPGAWDWLNERYEPIGVRFLSALRFYGPWYIATIDRVDSLAELRTLKIGTPTGIHKRFAEELGLTPVMVTGGERYTALERRLVDAECVGIDQHALGLHEVSSYLIGPSYKSVSNTSCFMNLDTWNRLGPELQDVVKEVFISIAYDAVRRDLGVAAINMQVWLDAGAEVIRPFTAAEEELYTSVYDGQGWTKLEDNLSLEDYQKIEELVTLPPDIPKLIRP